MIPVPDGLPADLSQMVQDIGEANVRPPKAGLGQGEYFIGILPESLRGLSVLVDILWREILKLNSLIDNQRSTICLEKCSKAQPPCPC